MTDSRKKIYKVIASDFETLLIEYNNFKKHKVYSYSISFYDDEKNKIVTFNDNICKNYENKSDFISDSASLFKSFFDKLVFIANKYDSLNIICYFHNLGNFDGIFILDNLNLFPNIQKTPEVLYRSGSIYSIKINNITFKDSYKLLRDSLNNLSKIFLDNRLKLKFNHDLISFNNLKKYKRKIISYNNNDSEILLLLIFRFNDEINQIFSDIDIFKSNSLSGVAFDIYKKMCSDEFKSISNGAKWDMLTYNTILESYKGGIVDVYKPHSFLCNVVDINSAYPYAMLNYLPSGDPEKVSNEELGNINNNFKLLDNIFGFIKLTINVEKTYMPFIGVRHPRNGLNIYPYGTFTVTIFSEELKYALKVNNIKILRVIRVYRFKKKKNLFNKYVKKFYSLKQSETNIAKKLTYKLLLNTLYGRFGLRRGVDLTLWVLKEDVHLYERILDIKVLGKSEGSSDYVLINVKSTYKDKLLKLLDQSLLDEKVKEDILKINQTINFRLKNIFTAPQIASAITAYTRIQTDSVKRLILKSKKNVCYTDTDSLFSDMPIKGLCSILDISGKIGSWSFGNCSMEGFFIAPKVYALLKGDKIKVIKFKGIEGKYKKNITKEQIKSQLSLNKIPILFKKKSPFVKDMKTLSIVYKEVDYRSDTPFKKRLKIYNDYLWVNTYPFNYDNI